MSQVEKLLAKCEALLGDLNSDNSISENTSQEQVRGPSSTSTISLTTTQRLIQNVQELINREPNFDKRRTYKERISNIKTKYSETQKALQMRQREQRKRMENGTVQAQSSSNQSIHDTYSKNAENLSRDELFSYPSGFSKDKASNEGASDRISRSLQQSLNYVDQYLDMGQSSLNKLREQGIDLKTTQKRLLDVANQLGLSQSVIRWIERRSTEDKWIFWGGVAVLTGIVLFVIIYWL